MKTTIDAMKPLQWSEECQPCDECRYNHIVADSGLGRISVEWKGWKATDSFTVYVAGVHVGDEFTLDVAKQFAAQHLLNIVLSLTLSREEAQTVEPVEDTDENPAAFCECANCANGFPCLYARTMEEQPDGSMIAVDPTEKPSLSVEREALISLQRNCVAELRETGRLVDDEGEVTNQLEQAADMLAADAQEIARLEAQVADWTRAYQAAYREATAATVKCFKLDAQQVEVPHSGADESPPVFARRWNIAADGFGLQLADDGVYVYFDDAVSVLHASLSAAPQPPQADRVQMTAAEIRAWWASENGLEDCDLCKLDDFTKAVRAFEAHHHIGGKA